MPYLIIDDFSAGIDRRKSRVTSKPGTLWELRNGYITAGGEIVKRKTITTLGVLPTGYTKGVGFVGNQLKVFGTHTPGVVPGLPANVGYQQLIPSASSLDRVLDVAPYGQNLYTICRMADGSVRHFYGSTEVAAMTNNGTQARAHKFKMYVVDEQNLRFSDVANPAAWSGTGSGIIDVGTVDAGMADLVGIEQYYGQLALFGRNAIQVWAMDPDPALNTLQQVIGNIGLVAPNGVSRYGNGDVLFLSHTGIRSLRARDSSNAAVLNDIGSPIDDIIAEKRAVLNTATVEKIYALVDPLTGQFWLVWGDEVHVLTYYPNSKVTAWSVFDLPWEPDYVTLANSRIVFRKNEELFIYGSLPFTGSPFDPNAPVGVNDAVYDAQPVTVITPMIDLQKPAHMKQWHGIDMSCEGEWDVYAAPDYHNPDTYTKIATVNHPTFGDARLPMDFSSTHIAFKFVSKNNGFSKISSFALHHNLGNDD